MAQLPNHLRSYRKRLALSQNEVAFLMGITTGQKVSRYENFSRVPSLEAALALEAILQKPVRELFPGLYQEIAQKIAERAKVLSFRKSSQQDIRKGQTLATIMNSSPKNL